MLVPTDLPTLFVEAFGMEDGDTAFAIKNAFGLSALWVAVCLNNHPGNPSLVTFAFSLARSASEGMVPEPCVGMRA
jgi:hypothetical protein